MKKLLIVFIPFLLFGCNSNTEKPLDKLTFTNNCEVIRGYSDSYGYSADYKYHGNYSNQLDTNKPYGVTFREKYSKLTAKKIKKVRLSAYGYYVQQIAQVSYCISVDLDGKNLFWGELNFKDYVKNPKVWQKAEAEISLPPTIDSNSIVSIFAWNKSKEPFFIDDYEFQFFE